MQRMMLQLTSTSAKLNLWAAVFSLFIGFHGISFFGSRVQGSINDLSGKVQLWCGVEAQSSPRLWKICAKFSFGMRDLRDSNGSQWHSTIFCWSFTRDYHLRPNSVDGKEDPRVLHAGVAWCGCRRRIFTHFGHLGTLNMRGSIRTLKSTKLF